MTTINTQKENTQTQLTTDHTGALADSARRHLVYEALSRHVALSEAALQRVLEALGAADARVTAKPREADPDSRPSV